MTDDVQVESDAGRVDEGERLAVQPPQVPDRGCRHGWGRRARWPGRRRALPGRIGACRRHGPSHTRAAHPHRPLQQLRRRVRSPRPRRRRQGEARRGRRLGAHDDQRREDPVRLPAADLRARRVPAAEPLQRRPCEVPVQAGRRAGLGQVAAHQLGRGHDDDRRGVQEGPGQVRQGLPLGGPVHRLAQHHRGRGRRRLPVRQRDRRQRRRLRGLQRGRQRDARRPQLRARRPRDDRRRHPRRPRDVGPPELQRHRAVGLQRRRDRRSPTGASSRRRRRRARRSSPSTRATRARRRAPMRGCPSGRARTRRWSTASSTT